MPAAALFFPGEYPIMDGDHPYMEKECPFTEEECPFLPEVCPFTEEECPFMEGDAPLTDERFPCLGEECPDGEKHWNEPETLNSIHKTSLDDRFTMVLGLDTLPRLTGGSS